MTQRIRGQVRLVPGSIPRVELTDEETEILVAAFDEMQINIEPKLFGGRLYDELEPHEQIDALSLLVPMIHALGTFADSIPTLAELAERQRTVSIDTLDSEEKEHARVLAQIRRVGERKLEIAKKAELLAIGREREQEEARARQQARAEEIREERERVEAENQRRLDAYIAERRAQAEAAEVTAKAEREAQAAEAQERIQRRREAAEREAQEAADSTPTRPELPAEGHSEKEA